MKKVTTILFFLILVFCISCNSSDNVFPSWARGRWHGDYENQDAEVIISKDDIKISDESGSISFSDILDTSLKFFSVYSRGIEISPEYANIDSNTFEVQLSVFGIGMTALRLKRIDSNRISFDIPLLDISIELSK